MIKKQISENAKIAARSLINWRICYYLKSNGEHLVFDWSGVIGVSDYGYNKIENEVFLPYCIISAVSVGAWRPTANQLRLRLFYHNET